MKRFIALLCGVFILALVVGATLPNAEAGPCYYKCICSVPHKCCVTNGVEVCKRVTDSPIQCTQGYPC